MGGFKTFFITILILAMPGLILQAQDSSEELSEYKANKSTIIDRNYVPPVNLKKQPLVFSAGGLVQLKSRIKFSSFAVNTAGSSIGLVPVPDGDWIAYEDNAIWMRMTFTKESFLHIGIRGLIKAERYDNEVFTVSQPSLDAVSLVPMFTVDSIYLHWKYPKGRVILGRTNYHLRSTHIFNGPLDGLQIDINAPFLNFKAFAGYTGLIGIFNPWFNPYAITSFDRFYQEKTNLLKPVMILDFNANQARRIFFGADFDIHFTGRHFNPYFLMQYDMSALFNSQNNEHDVTTFHVGLNLDGKIIQNLYYKVDLSGLFGYHPGKNIAQVPIVACSLVSSLRYSIAVKTVPTFQIGYSLGTGNSEDSEYSIAGSDFLAGSKYGVKSIGSTLINRTQNGFWADEYGSAGDTQNKFYYYGTFDGGFVLEPVLSNIHSLSFRFSITPVNGNKFSMTYYAAFYQTFKMFPTGPISDDNAALANAIVGSEINTGLMLKAGGIFFFGFDLGVLFRLTAYPAALQAQPLFKAGAVAGFTI
jgi:hypothetical protein